ncbi:hypothetical protein HPB52_009199 [Rhipicephalus sanguineus]|uniref:Uncharacterized protein n=1 Tax=Rhipicephalus sanguineus TaxID=34632 RepID=A0A9D4PJ59_RHISA|nr:hypothetical protein HPB52_009199 [Rhipicephalus sanguineus]
MALSANDVTVRLSMNEGVSELVQRLDALSPDTVSELVLRNCRIRDTANLCKQIARCVGLRCLSCVACTIPPSQLIKFTLVQLQHLEHLELSLFEDSKAAVSRERKKVRRIVSEMRAVAVTHTLRRVYVEVGGDHNFRLLRRLLNTCLNVTELHVHLVRGTFSKALKKCQRLHKKRLQLEVFVFTSELPASAKMTYKTDPSSLFENCATICANVRRKRSDDSWSCAELGHLVRSSDRAHNLPSQVVVFAVSDLTVTSLREETHGHLWKNVRELCILLLPEDPSSVLYPKAGPAHREGLVQLSLVLDCIAELNVSSFHFRPDVSLDRLLQKSPLGHRLLALSAPPCWFQSQSSVRMLTISCPNLSDLDVRVISRGGLLSCDTCHNLLFNTGAVQESSDAATLLSTSIVRLTLCEVPYNVQLWFFQYYGAAVTLRVSEWRFVGSPQYGHLCELFHKCGAIRCLLLQHHDLPINEEHLQASLSRLTSLQHLCLLTSMKVSDDDASKFVRDFVAQSAQLKCLHLHYRKRSSEQRVTWLRNQEQVSLRQGPCFACCSTATFIGLAKPVNRDCVADL